MKSGFQKLRWAATRNRGVELTATDVWLLWELAGDALEGAEAAYEKWREIIRRSAISPRQ